MNNWIVYLNRSECLLLKYHFSVFSHIYKVSPNHQMKKVALDRTIFPSSILLSQQSTCQCKVHRLSQTFFFFLVFGFAPPPVCFNRSGLPGGGTGGGVCVTFFCSSLSKGVESSVGAGVFCFDLVLSLFFYSFYLLLTRTSSLIYRFSQW